MDKPSPEQVAIGIVDQFAWTANIMSRGMMVSQDVAVAALIAEAIEKEREQFKIVLDSYATENQQFSDEIDRLRSALDPLARSADTAVVLMKQFYPAEAASLNAHVAVAKVALADLDRVEITADRT